jgi:putative transposase
VIAANDLPVKVACRVLGVSESGFYEQRKRPPCERAIRHAMLTDLIAQIHAESNGTYGIARVHAELTLGRGVAAGHNQVELLMRRAGLQGMTGRRKWKRIKPDNIAIDLVQRDFTRHGPNQLWSPTSPNTPPGKGRSTAVSSWTPIPGGSWAGRSTARRPRRW